MPRTVGLKLMANCLKEDWGQPRGAFSQGGTGHARCATCLGGATSDRGSASHGRAEHNRLRIRDHILCADSAVRAR